MLLIEHIVGCADHPTVHHYEKLDAGGVGPGFATTVDEGTLNFCRKLHQGVLDFGHLDQRVVNLGRADSHAVPVERRVGAAEHETTPPLVDAEKIPVPPDPGIPVEIRVPVARAVGIVPKAHRHAGQRPGDDQLPDLVHDRLAGIVEGERRHPELAPLDLPRVHRQGHDAAHDAGAKIGAAAARVCPHIGLHIPVAPAHRRRGDRRAREHQ